MMANGFTDEEHKEYERLTAGRNLAECAEQGTFSPLLGYPYSNREEYEGWLQAR